MAVCLCARCVRRLSTARVARTFHCPQNAPMRATSSSFSGSTLPTTYSRGSGGMGGLSDPPCWHTGRAPSGGARRLPGEREGHAATRVARKEMPRAAPPGRGCAWRGGHDAARASSWRAVGRVTFFPFFFPMAATARPPPPRASRHKLVWQTAGTVPSTRAGNEQRHGRRRTRRASACAPARTPRGRVAVLAGWRCGLPRRCRGRGGARLVGRFTHGQTSTGQQGRRCLHSRGKATRAAGRKAGRDGAHRLPAWTEGRTNARHTLPAVCTKAAVGLNWASLDCTELGRRDMTLT